MGRRCPVGIPLSLQDGQVQPHGPTLETAGVRRADAGRRNRGPLGCGFTVAQGSHGTSSCRRVVTSGLVGKTSDISTTESPGCLTVRDNGDVYAFRGARWAQSIHSDKTKFPGGSDRSIRRRGDEGRRRHPAAVTSRAGALLAEVDTDRRGRLRPRGMPLVRPAPASVAGPARGYPHATTPARPWAEPCLAGSMRKRTRGRSTSARRGQPDPGAGVGA